MAFMNGFGKNENCSNIVSPCVFLSQSQFILAALIVSQLRHFVVIYSHWKKTTGLPMRETLNICTNIRIPHLQAYLVGLTYNILFAYSFMNTEIGKKACEKRGAYSSSHSQMNRPNQHWLQFPHNSICLLFSKFCPLNTLSFLIWS